MTEKFQELLRKMRAAFDSADKHPSWNTEKEDAVWEKIRAQTAGPGRSLRWLRWTAAAAILIIATTVYYRAQHNDAPAVAKANQRISPGANRAYLVLATGQHIVLDDVKKAPSPHREAPTWSSWTAACSPITQPRPTPPPCITPSSRRAAASTS
ncbi:hypothetical protein ACQ86N_24830 [Puia sp. P3]|uniref:hypothetical protein n=1 Tax=Puia sp. P3 TaxID=3423952 RepID=UPI003D67BBAF